jgi:hypothetical protein
MRKRTRSDFSCGSIWISEARERMASSNTVCSSLTTGASSAPGRRSEQIAEFDRHIAQVGGQFLGQAADFFGTPIDAIDQRQQMALGNDHQVDFARRRRKTSS